MRNPTEPIPEVESNYTEVDKKRMLWQVTNWPPGWFEPGKCVQPPRGRAEDLVMAEEKLKAAKFCLDDWETATRRRRARAWVKYHERHGWPEDMDEEQRWLLRCDAGVYTPESEE